MQTGSEDFTLPSLMGKPNEQLTSYLMIQLHVGPSGVEAPFYRRRLATAINKLHAISMNAKPHCAYSDVTHLLPCSLSLSHPPRNSSIRWFLSLHLQYSWPCVLLELVPAVCWRRCSYTKPLVFAAGLHRKVNNHSHSHFWVRYNNDVFSYWTKHYPYVLFKKFLT